MPGNKSKNESTSARMTISNISSREIGPIEVELLALIEAIEHHRQRQKSLRLRLTTPDYLPVMVERLRMVLAVLQGPSS